MTDDPIDQENDGRRWQFSLRSLFWLTTLAAFYLLLFITIIPMGDDSDWQVSFFGDFVWLFWLYGLLTMVVALWFFTSREVHFWIVAGYFMAILSFLLIWLPVTNPYNGIQIRMAMVWMIFIGTNGAAFVGGIRAVFLGHKMLGNLAILMSLASCVMLCCLLPAVH